MPTMIRRRVGGQALPDSLATYLREIRSYPLLSRAEEAELGRRIRQGDADALQRLVCSNLRFVVAIAKRYQHHGVPLADLIDEGNIGLIRAAGRYDETRGAKFISYAVWWVRQAMVQAIADYGHVVRLPLSRAEKIRRIRRHANALRQDLGREPRSNELAADLRIAEEEVSITIPASRGALSLDAPMSDGSDATLLDYLADDVVAAPDDDATGANLADSVISALAALPPREAKVLRMYFGFGGGDPMTLEAIGEQLGVTRERVRQIKDRALWRIRTSSDAAVLATFREK
jgi:RNA polymerase primary sigma factor